MERIKEALERAREERFKIGDTGVMRDAPGPAPAAAQIMYTHTRTEEVPINVLRDMRVIAAVDSAGFTDAYGILRTQVLQRLRDKKWNALAVTSPGTAEGKTLTAINLAISLAREVDYTVLLVDADLRDPAVHTYFGIHPEKGLSDYLLNDTPLSELLVHPSGIGRFVVLPGGQRLDNSSEMLNSPKMVRLVDELKARYSSRIVLFDLPPLLSTADALAFSPYVDAALLVVEEGVTPASEIQRAAELLSQNTQIIGTVLNKAKGVKSQNRDTVDQSGVGSARGLGALGNKLLGLAKRVTAKTKKGR
ncbi:MAG: CpsD/CapB family tyrosine-protein kinase [Gammaproteobacteria bacterium]|nr:CpsD/CapB family tyrosine-protein kinase [Gammaproteobacteria bacterium]